MLCWLCTATFVAAQHQENRAHADEFAAAERPVAVTGKDGEGPTGSNPSAEHAVPQKAYDLLAQLRERDGTPLPSYIGGRIFRNRERRLPAGRYREYDVNRKRPSRARDAERIVIEQRSGKAYYTGDHYRTFIPLN